VDPGESLVLPDFTFLQPPAGPGSGKSINQSKHICIAAYVANESEAHSGWWPLQTVYPRAHAAGVGGWRRLRYVRRKRRRKHNTFSVLDLNADDEIRDAVTCGGRLFEVC